MKRYIGPALCVIVISLVSGAAMAVSECPNNNIVELWGGAGGEILIVLDNAPPIYVQAPTSATDSAQKNAMATALTALAAGKVVTIRYATDGVACASGPSRTDFAGIWIMR
jgi:hypothetical protein